MTRTSTRMIGLLRAAAVMSTLFATMSGLGLSAAQARPFDLGPVWAGTPSAIVLAQAGAPPPPEPSFAGIRTLRLQVDILSIPDGAAPACAMNEAGMVAAATAGLGRSGIRLIGPTRPAGVTDADWVGVPIMGIIVIAMNSPTNCDFTLQALLTASISATTILATGIVIPAGDLTMWMTTQARRSTYERAGAELREVVSGVFSETAERITRATLASPAPAAPAMRTPSAGLLPAAPAPLASMRACPNRWGDLGATPPSSIDCACSAGAVAAAGPVWGTEVYTDDSLVCRAALHAGAVSTGGGAVTVLREAGRPSYAGSSRNGIQTSNYGSWTASFRFAAPATQKPSAAPITPERR